MDERELDAEFAGEFFVRCLAILPLMNAWMHCRTDQHDRVGF